MEPEASLPHSQAPATSSPVPILSQINPAMPTSDILKNHFNIILPSTPRSPKWSPSLKFSHQKMYAPLLSLIRATCPAHLILDLIIRIILRGVQIINLLKPTGHVIHHQFNIQQLYALPTLYLYVLYLSQHKQRLVPLTA